MFTKKFTGFELPLSSWARGTVNNVISGLTRDPEFAMGTGDQLKPGVTEPSFSTVARPGIHGFRIKCGMTACISSSILISLLILCSCGPRYPEVFQCQVGQYPLQERTNAITPSPVEFVEFRPNWNPGLYYIKMNFGDSSQPIDLVVDTGSSNVVVPGDSNLCPTCSDPSFGVRYTPSGDAKNLGKSFDVHYGSGHGTVFAYQDQVKIACSNLVPTSTQFGVLTSVQNLPGILGLGYKAIGFPHHGPQPLFFDQLVKNSGGQLGDIFAMTFCGSRSGSSVVLGNIDNRIARDSLTYIPITQQSFYVIQALNLEVKDWTLNASNEWIYQPGTQSVLGTFSPQRTIVDSGTTLNYLPFTMAQNVLSLMRAVNQKIGANIPDDFWSGNPQSSNYAIKISSEILSQFPVFQIGVLDTQQQLQTLEMSPLNYFKSWDHGNRIFSLLPANGLNILGEAFMEGFHVEFDRVNSRIGFASNAPICGDWPE